ncbi:MAG: class I SAM-dependent methyltransferase [Burkholderiaceae bacterium]
MTTSRSAGFTDAAETWNHRFAGEDFLFGTEPNGWLRAHASLLPPGGRILSVADGEGRNSVWLAQQGYVVEAFDIAAVGVAKARALAERAGVHVNFTVADCDSFAWRPAHYDGVAAIFIQFADPALRDRLFRRIIESLKPGGILVLQGYTPKQLEYRTGGPPFESHLYTAELLRAAFAALEILVLREYEDVLTEGAGHSGQSALVGMVARRR